MNMGNRKRRALLRVIALACALVVSTPLVFQGGAARAAAGASTISLSPSAGTYGLDQTFQVSIMLDTNGEAVNAVQADLSFPADKLEVTGLDYRTGAFLLLVLDHSYDNAAGQVHVAGGLPSPGFTGTAGRVATVTFKTKAAGTANVTLDATSAVLRNADSVNILTGRQPGQFTISGGETLPGGLVFLPSIVSCTEGSNTAFAVRLATAPAAAVTVALSSDSQATLVPASVTFGASDWNSPRVVIVSVTDDAAVQGTRTVAVQSVVTSTDPAYQGLATVPVLVTIYDNDVAPTGHLITASVSGAGGAIAPGGRVAVADQSTVRFVMTPDEGHEIDTVTVDGSEVAVLGRASMAYDFRSVAADHTISCTFRLAKDTTPPALTLVGLTGTGIFRAVTRTLPWKLAVRCTDDRGAVMLKVMDGASVLAQASVEGEASVEISLKDGNHKLTVSATDAAANSTSQEVELVVDTTGPAITVTSSPGTTSVSSLTIQGHVSDTPSGVASLTIDGSQVSIGSDGSFSYRATLTRGTNTFRFGAADNLGNTSATTVSVSYVPMVTIVLRIGDPVMTVDGRVVPIDASGKVAPIIQNGRTLLPARALIEALGGTVEWDAIERKATISLNGSTLQLWIGKGTAMVDGRTVPIDPSDKKVMPVIAQGRTLLPLRFVAESLGLEITWDALLRRVTITGTT